MINFVLREGNTVASKRAGTAHQAPTLEDALKMASELQCFQATVLVVSLHTQDTRERWLTDGDYLRPRNSHQWAEIS